MENLEELKKRFRIVDGVLERLYDKDKTWRKAYLYVANKYVSVEYWYNHIQYHRVYWQIYHNEQIPKGMMLDHIDGNRLNNDLSNLRVVTPRENSRNTARIRAGNHVGVSMCKQRKQVLWSAVVCIRKDQVRIGRYKDKEIACYTQEFAEKLLYLYDGDKQKFREEVRIRLKKEKEDEQRREAKSGNGQYCFGEGFTGNYQPQCGQER
jgi:hypothetical protein